MKFRHGQWFRCFCALAEARSDTPASLEPSVGGQLLRPGTVALLKGFADAASAAAESPRSGSVAATAILVISLLWIASRAGAAELPVRQGLVIAIDASAQAGVRREASLPPIGNLQPVDFVLDSANGEGRLAQPIAERRPVFYSDGEAAYFNFDGKDDFLGVSGKNNSVKAITIFLLAAPKENPGNFSALFGAARAGENDYTTGLNLDFGPAPTKELSVINVESAGAIGFRDLLTPGFFNAAERPFGDFHVFSVRSKPGKAGIEVFLDGFKGGERDRDESEIGLDEMVLGGRFYSNDGTQPPFAQGFFQGAISDLLVYGRALSDEERHSVEQWLLGKTVA